MTRRKLAAKDRFWIHVIDGLNGCRLWTGAVGGKSGRYGRFNDGTRIVQAHRFAYEQTGRVIPEGLTLDHLCRTPECVNPSHLEPATRAENIRRAAAHKTHCPHGHEYTPENTLISTRAGERICRACRRDSARKLRLRNGERPRPQSQLPPFPVDPSFVRVRLEVNSLAHGGFLLAQKSSQS